MTAPFGSFKYTGTSFGGELAKLASGLVQGGRDEQERQRQAAMEAALQKLRERQTDQADQRIGLDREGLDLSRSKAAQDALNSTESANLGYEKLNAEKGLKAEDDKRQAARDSETGRHNRATEAVSNRRIDQPAPGKGWRLVPNLATGNMEWVAPPTEAGAPISPETGKPIVSAVAGAAPAAQRGEFNENEANDSTLDAAMAAVDARPQSFGLKFMGPDLLNQRMDPEGVAARAAVANIGSLKIKQRSGAAVTAKEFPRLKPFVPDVNDTADAIKTKLTQFKAELARINAEIAAGNPSDPRVHRAEGGEGKTPPPADAKAYYDSLRAAGKTPQEALQLTDAKYPR